MAIQPAYNDAPVWINQS